MFDNGTNGIKRFKAIRSIFKRSREHLWWRLEDYIRHLLRRRYYE